MARAPISFYLNILAGILVLFNHYAASETGDVALNKVTGAAGRFYVLFQDTSATLRHGWTSRLEMMLCDAMDNFLPRDTVEILRLKGSYCDEPAQDTENKDRTTNGPQPRVRYGGSDFAFMDYQPHMRPLESRISAGHFLRKPSFGQPSQSRLSQAVWEWSGEAMAMLGILLLRVWASYWWFRAPLQVTSVFLVAYLALPALDHLIGMSVVVQWVSQMFMIIVVDCFQCIEWEAQRHAVDIGVVVMKRAFGFATGTCRCT